MTGGAPDTHPLLWTGGWDSTFRLLDLVLTYERRVQPYYLIDSTRPSLAHELRAMRAIRSALAERSPEAGARVAPTIYADVEDIPPDPVVTARMQRLAAKVNDFLGPQYEWLIRFTQDRRIEGIEFGLEWGIKWEKMCGDRMWRVEDDTGGYTGVFPDGPDDDRQALAVFKYPIIHLTKGDMARLARERGFIDLMELTWFCHQPTPRGQPCGTCGPCRYARNQGLGHRLPRSAALRFARYRVKYARDGVRRRIARRSFRAEPKPQMPAEPKPQKPAGAS